MGVNGLYKKISPFLIKNIKLEAIKEQCCGIDVSSFIHAIGSVYANNPKKIVQLVIRCLFSFYYE